MLLDPGMIGRGVVRDEIQHQPQPAIAQALPDARQRRIAAEIRVRRIARDREPGAGDVVFPQVGERLLELVTPPGVGA
jgi:hypothetical protein